jgi:restriction endonuclease
MIINTQVFNTTNNEEKNIEGRSGNEAARIIYTKRDEFGSVRPIEQAKISCAKKQFNEISTNSVKYHDVDSYQSLLTVMETL